MKLQQYLFFFLVLTAFSCTTMKKVQVIQEALAKKDTAQLQLVTEIKKVDSVAIVKDILQKITSTKLDFKTMNARIKVDYESPKNADSYIANLSMLKDSAIFITIRGAMGVIGIKALIKKDSVVLIYPLNKKVERKPLSYLQEVIKIPFTFTTIQDLFIGNPIFMENNKIVSYKMANNKLEVGLMGSLFKNLIILNDDNSKVLHLKLDDIDISQHRTCNITYSGHTTANQYQFPLIRDISISANSKLNIHMEIKEYSFNDPIKYAFAIPKPGKRK
jgi:hypothetical protein